MLTPIDIQNHSLKTAVRGYSKKETDDFLDEILKGYEELYKENRDLKEKVTSLSEGISYYKQMETTLQKALVLAEKTSTETQEAAKSKADAMTNEAQAKADALLKEAQAKAEAVTKEAQAIAEAVLKESQSEAEGLRKEIQAYSEITKSKANRELEDTRNHVRKLVQSYENYRLQFKKLAESQIEMLESEHYSIFAPELEEMLGDAPDADAVMEAERNVPINAPDNYYEENSAAGHNTEGKKEESQAANATVAVEMPETNVSTKSTPEVMENQIAENNGPVAQDITLVNAAATVELPEVQEGKKEGSVQPEISSVQPAAMETATSKEDEEALERARLMAEIKIPDMEITADTIVPGVAPPENSGVSDTMVQALEVEPEPVKESVPAWENTTPKLAGYDQIEVSKTVSPMPDAESPFVFIDTE